MVMGATITVPIYRFVSSGEVTTHGRVLRILWPWAGAKGDEEHIEAGDYQRHSVLSHSVASLVS